MGFCIAAPVGPVGLLCIRRSITDGRVTGFFSGLGAATADALYGLLAALSLGAVTQFLLGHRNSFQFFGGIFLISIGVKIVRSKSPDAVAGSAHARNLATAYVSTFALTLANPTTIFSFIGILAALGVGVNPSGVAPASWLVTGVFLGSAVWWLVLSTSASWLGAKLHAGRLHFINVSSGFLLIAYGGWQLARIF